MTADVVDAATRTSMTSGIRVGESDHETGGV